MAAPWEILLYPDLLSNEQMIRIIRATHLRIENIEQMSRPELLKLFRNFCVPCEQRVHRDTGRGKMLNQTRQHALEPNQSVTNMNNNHSMTSLHSKWYQVPPPDPLSEQMKRMKLDHNTSIEEDINHIIRKMGPL